MDLQASSYGFEPRNRAHMCLLFFESKCSGFGGVPTLEETFSFRKANTLGGFEPQIWKHFFPNRSVRVLGACQL